MTIDILRRCVFRPYRKGMGPVFTLAAWDTNHTDSRGKSILGYRLKMDGKPIFQGEDFHCSPMHCIDSDETVKAIMSFLTLRPGDTDSEYFDNYTPSQLDYC